jgi:hypothetical protein
MKLFFLIICLASSTCVPSGTNKQTEKFRADTFDAGTETQYLEVSTAVGVRALLHLQRIQDTTDGYPRAGFDPFTRKEISGATTVHAQMVVFHPTQPYRAYYIETPHVRRIRFAELTRLKAKIEDAEVSDSVDLVELSSLTSTDSLSKEWSNQ